MDLPPRIDLAITPTPLQHLPHLSEAWNGPHIWVKRDDLTGFELSGNKVRKLEFHLAAALADRADTVITTGAIQSNHCRATAFAAARLGLRSSLLLRTADGEPPAEVRANHRLHRLAGAEIRYVDPAGYQRRDDIMADMAREVADAGGRAWVIPEGASDALGMLGMAAGFSELGPQMAEAGIDSAVVWHASSSAGTTAGFGWAADRTGPDLRIVAVSVGDAIDHLASRVEELWVDASARFGGSVPAVDIEYRDEFIAGGYGIPNPGQAELEADATARTGMLFDPTYTGKALFGLHEHIKSGRFGSDEHVIFWHTGGGFAAL